MMFARRVCILLLAVTLSEIVAPDASRTPQLAAYSGCWDHIVHD
jgi:hypothetical protein